MPTTAVESMCWLELMQACFESSSRGITEPNEASCFVMAKQHMQANLLMTVSGLQDCLSFGKPLLIENIEEELDPVLDPVLERRYVKKGRGYTVALADKEVYQMGMLLFNMPQV